MSSEFKQVLTKEGYPWDFEEADTPLMLLAEGNERASRQLAQACAEQAPPIQRSEVFALDVESKALAQYQLVVGEQLFGPVDRLSADDLEALWALAAPSPFGEGDETKYDESVRLAKELPLAGAAGAAAAGAACAELRNLRGQSLAAELARAPPPELKRWLRTAKLSDHDDHIVLKPYKLVLYRAGGFFRAHRDTVRGAEHLGTLLVALPTPHTGGALRLGDQSVQLGAWQGVAFLTDLEHELARVESGLRAVLSLEVHVVAEPQHSLRDPSRSVGDALSGDPRAVAAAIEPLLARCGCAAIALRHLYSAAEAEAALSSAGARLRGADRDLGALLGAAGYRFLLLPLIHMRLWTQRGEWSWAVVPLRFRERCAERGRALPRGKAPLLLIGGTEHTQLLAATRGYLGNSAEVGEFAHQFAGLLVERA